MALRMKVVAAGVMVGALLSGCASSYYAMDFNRVGVQAGTFSAQQSVSPEQVSVYFGSPPDGVDASGNVLGGRGQLLAEADLQRSTARWSFQDFNEEWRRYYCPINMALDFGTLFIYGLTGLPAPCFYETQHSSPERIEERKATILRMAKMKAAEIGANTIFIPSFGRSSVMTTRGFGLSNSTGSARLYGNTAYGSGLTVGQFHSQSERQTVPVDSAKVFFYSMPK